jgi:hypothetical protein
MAAFKVLQTFRVTGEMQPQWLAAGAVYREGDTISGLTAPETVELLKMAPEGSFEAKDEEAVNLATYVVNLGGKLGTSGAAQATKKEGE